MRLLTFLAVFLPGSAVAEPGPVPRAVRLDLDGDILQPGVISRLGSTRFMEVSASRVTVTADGTRAICVDDTNVRTWHLATGRLLSAWPLPVNRTPLRRRVAIEPYGFIASVSDDGRTAIRLTQRTEDSIRGIAEVWDLLSASRIRSFTADKIPAFSVAAISPDGRRVATVDYHQRPFRIRMWDVSTGEGKVIAGHDNSVLQLLWVDGGRKLLAVVYGNDACAHDPDTGREIYRVKLPSRYTILPNRGGTRFALYEPPADLTVFDAATGEPVRSLTYPKDCTNPRALSADGTQIVCFRTDHTALWDLAAGKERMRLPTHEYAAVAFGPDDKFIVFAGNGLRLVDAATGKELAGPNPTRGSPREPGPFGWAADGTAVHVAGHHGELGLFYDPDTGKVVPPNTDRKESDWYRPGLHSIHQNWDQVQGLQRFPWCPLKDAAGMPAFGHATVSGDVRFVGVRSFQKVFTSPVDVTNMPLHKRLPINCFDVAVHERVTGAELFKLEIPVVGEVCFSSDNRRLATLEPDRLRVWEVISGKLLIEHMTSRPDRPPTGEGFGIALAFSPDNRRLAINNRDGTILIWDVAVPEVPEPLVADELPHLWDELGAPDPKVGWHAAFRLASTPDRALPFLLDRLKPAHSPDAAAAKKLLADLDSPAYRTREAAMKRVLELGDAARPFLDASLKGAPGPELRKRLEELRATFHDTDPPRGTDLRRLRALYVLERIDSKKSRAKIEELTTGLPAARLTVEARLVWQRVEQRGRKMGR